MFTVYQCHLFPRLESVYRSAENKQPLIFNSLSSQFAPTSATKGRAEVTQPGNRRSLPSKLVVVT